MIKIENLVKTYGDIRAVDNISFEVKEGEIVGFLGPNGAGKSTTMNMLTGYLSSTSGTATIDGINILENPLEAKKRIGFLPEQPPLYLDMTVEEYLNFIYDLKGCKLNRRKHLLEICEVVRITEVYKRLIRNLSKGYKQRVGIAQALVGNPKVIIFDEPTVGLDPKQIVEIRNLIRTLGKNHTVILSTHILPEVSAICERIVVINKGKLIANEKTEEISRVVEGFRRLCVKIVGPKEEILDTLKKKEGISYCECLGAREADSNAYLIESDPGVDIRRPLFFALAEHGWPMIGEETMSTNLEDVFLALLDKNDERKKKRGVVKSNIIAR
ncbi:MAG: ATP-binding cassette domain-containing protein [Clostridia bacterium]|nr:ATP-binding cassette domain-containing protein [Clostridia bacterium]